MYLVRYSRKILPKPQWIRPSKVPVLVPIFEAVDHVGAVIVDPLQILLAVLFLIFCRMSSNGKKTLPFGGEIPVKRHSGNACQLGKLRYGNGGQRLFF